MEIDRWFRALSSKPQPHHPHPRTATYDIEWLNQIMQDLILAPSDKAINRLHLTWAIVYQSITNAICCLYSPLHNETPFLEVLKKSLQMYPDSLEIQLALLLLSAGKGFAYNTRRGLDNLLLAIPDRYKIVIHQAFANFHPLVSPNNALLPAAVRVVDLHWTAPLGWMKGTSYVDRAKSSIALLIEPQSGDYFPANSAPLTSATQIAMDTVDRLVSSTWGPLGTKVLDAFLQFISLLLDPSSTTAEVLVNLYPDPALGVHWHRAESRLSLWGSTTFSEWNLIISCVKWLISTIGDPGPPELIIRKFISSSPAIGKMPAFRHALPPSFR